MATVIVTLTKLCTGGGHATFSISGDVSRTIDMHLENLGYEVTDEMVENFIKVLLKLAKLGRTISQLKTTMQSGLTVSV